jgi:hypothetical protein
MEIIVLYLVVTWIINYGVYHGIKKIDGLNYDSIIIFLFWLLTSWFVVPFILGTWYAKEGRGSYKDYDAREKSKK